MNTDSLEKFIYKLKYAKYKKKISDLKGSGNGKKRVRESEQFSRDLEMFRRHDCDDIQDRDRCIGTRRCHWDELYETCTDVDEDAQKKLEMYGRGKRPRKREEGDKEEDEEMQQQTLMQRRKLVVKKRSALRPFGSEQSSDFDAASPSSLAAAASASDASLLEPEVEQTPGEYEAEFESLLLGMKKMKLGKR